MLKERELRQLLAAVGSMLRDMLFGKVPRDRLMILLCHAIIELCDVGIRHAPLKPGRRKPKSEAPTDLTHPNAAAERDALLNRMEVRAAAALRRGRPLLPEEIEKEIEMEMQGAVTERS